MDRKKVLIISLSILVLLLCAWWVIRGQWEHSISSYDKGIIVLNETGTQCGGGGMGSCKLEVTNSYWEGSNLIVEGIFEVNCCPGKVIYTYNLSGKDLTVLSMDARACNCFGYNKATLRIPRLEKKDYDLSIEYEYSEALRQIYFGEFEQLRQSYFGE